MVHTTLYRAVTRARACVVRRSNVLECVGLSTMTRMFCSMHAGLLDGRCLGRCCWVSLEQLGALCGGCVCQSWDYYVYICIMYRRMTLALMRCESCCCHFSFTFLFFSSVIFPHAVFIVRKFIVISIVPIQYCLAHLKLISVI